ncbi:MAG: hypothetical protein QXE38_04910 [Candidatus Methanomethylicia archaeon]
MEETIAYVKSRMYMFVAGFILIIMSFVVLGTFSPILVEISNASYQGQLWYDIILFAPYLTILFSIFFGFLLIYMSLRG